MAFINAFEWPESQWATVLVPCLIGLAQQAMETLPLQEIIRRCGPPCCRPSTLFPKTTIAS